MAFKIWRILENEDVVLERLSDLAHIMRSKSDLFSAHFNSDLSFTKSGGESLSISKLDVVKGPLDSYSQEDQAIAMRKMAYIKLAIKELGEKPSCEKLKVHLQAFSQHIGDKTPPGAYTAYRWWRDWRRSGEDISVLVPKPNKGRVSSYIQDYRALLSEVRDELIYQKVPGTKLDAYQLFKSKIIEMNSLKAMPLNVPSKATFHRLLDKVIDPYELVLTQEGRQVANKVFRATGEGVRTTRILERVEIDHTPINLMVIDEVTGEVSGRPSLTVIIDHYSKMPLGIYVGFEPPSGVSVMRAIRNAILPKTELEKQFPDFKHKWPAYGIFGLMACDNGSEFHDKQLKRMCNELNIELLFCPKQHSWYKGSIERFVGTINDAVCNKMDGTTFSNITDRGEYKSVAEAKHTLKDLEHYLLDWIINIYNVDFHESLGDTPFNVWTEGLKQFEPSLPASKASLDLTLTQEHQRKVNHEGVSFSRLKYNSAELGLLRQQSKNNLTARIRIDPENLGSVWVYDEFDGVFFSVPCSTPEVAEGLSLRQLEYMHQGREDRRKAIETDELLQRKVDFIQEIRKGSQDQKLRERTKAARLSQVPVVESKKIPLPVTKKRSVSSLSLPDGVKDFDLIWGEEGSNENRLRLLPSLKV